MSHSVSPSVQRGASTTEFIVVAPVLLFLGLGALQLGLIYHGNSVLAYATFEAARTGATHHALPGPMRRELGVRLAPLAGGDGSMGKAAEAIVRSIAEVELRVTADGVPKPATKLAILNPTRASFDAWGYDSAEASRKAIPNSHLRHRGAGAAEGVRGDPPQSLADANLLKIEVTHGLELKVPFVGYFLSRALAVADPGNVDWYAANRLPLKSVATVRMQSEAWIDALRPATAAAPADEVADEPVEADPAAPAAPVEESGGDDGAEAAGVACDTETGLGSSPVLIDSAGYENGSCGIADTGYDSPGGGGPGEDADVAGEGGPIC